MPPIDPDEPTLPPQPPAHGHTLPYEPAAETDIAHTRQIVGDYELQGEISRGGMGIVYRARQISLNRPVALKMILTGRLASAAEIRRFKIEAESAAQLDHPNIVPIYEVGENEGQPYFSMALVTGGSLADKLISGPLPIRDAAEIVRHLATAVEYAHQQGIVHRDLKPANVLLDDRGSPRITDFGLAKRAQAADGPTTSGAILGTPAYMAPEQAAGQTGLIGPLTDVYALGAVLYACLTGRPPFLAATPFDTQMQVIEQSPMRPSNRRSGVPRDLDTICLKCLEKRPERRYGSAKDLASDLQRFFDGEPIRARPTSRVRRAWHWARKRPWVISVAATLALLVVIGIVYSLRAEIRERERHVEILTARAERLALPPNPPPDAIDRIARRLRKATAIRPDLAVYEEGIQLLYASGRGFRRAYPRPGVDADPPLLFAGNAAWRPGSITWDRTGRELLMPGWSVNAVTGHRTALKIGDARAAADPSGRWLVAISGQNALIRDRLTGEERRIELGPATLSTLRFRTDGSEFLVFTSDRDRESGSIDFWRPTGDKPRITVPFPTGMVVFWAISDDWSRLAWVGQNDLTITVIRTDTGEQVATVPMIGAFASPMGLALNADGTRVAWTQLGYRSNDPERVIVQDVATGRRLAGFAASTNLALLGPIAYAPRDEFLIGHQVNSEKVDDRFITRDRIVVWDATSGRLQMVLPGETFAAGIGADGEIAIARRRNASPDAPVTLDTASPEALAAAMTHLGLNDNLGARPLDEIQIARLSQAFSEYLFNWPFGLGFLAALTITVAQRLREKRGLAAPPLISVAAVAAGAVAAAAGLLRYLEIFELPQLHGMELFVYLLLGSLSVFTAVVAIWYGVRNYRSAVSGRNVPVILPPTNRWRQISDSLDRIAFTTVAYGALVVAFAVQDGRVALKSAATVVVLVAGCSAIGFAIAPFLILLMRSVRRLWVRIAPTRPNGFVRGILLLTGIWSLAAIGRRLVSLITHWPFRPIQSASGLGFHVDSFPLAAVLDAGAIIAFITIWLAGRRERARRIAADRATGTN